MIKQLGEFDAEIRHGYEVVKDTIHVLQGTKGLFMSWYASRDLNLLPLDYPNQQNVSPSIATVVKM